MRFGETMSEFTLKNKYQTERIISIFDRVDEYYRYLIDTEPTLNPNHFLYREYTTYITYINSLLKKIDPTYTFFLINCFYGTTKENKTWWKGQYSKSTFYRIRQQAMQAFLEKYKPWNELRNY